MNGKMLKSKKHVFWEALLITIVIFIGGILLGILIETNNSNKINNLYVQSEISLTDAMTMSRLSEEFNFSCDSIKKGNIEFANRIYEEARQLEKYEEAGKLTDNLKLLHKEYDLLRTLLWTSNQKSLERCKDYNLVVYLYEYETKVTEQKAKQNVWSKILLETKEQNEDILLLPIATDQNLTSLNLLINQYEVKQFPALVINNKYVVYALDSTESVEDYLE